MAPPSVDRATTLKDAFRVCDVEPLQGESLERYYVDLSSVRSVEAIQGISTQLTFLEPGQFGTVLLAGSRGCGKSTELRRLQQSWEANHRVIYLEADEELDINDIEYIDLYLIILKQVLDELARLELTLNEQLLECFENWFKDVTKEIEDAAERVIGLTTPLSEEGQIPVLSKLLAKLLAQIKEPGQQRWMIRQQLVQEVNRLKAEINLLLKDADEKVRQVYPNGLLLIFDNLDRVPPKVSDRLFFDSAPHLQQINCTIVYTLPIAIVYSDKHLTSTFCRPNILPTVNLYAFEPYRRDLLFSKPAVQKFAMLVAQRINIAAVFESERLVIQLVVASGGLVRQLMQMTATACLIAASRGHAKVTSDDIDYAIQQEQFKFERVLSAHHYSILVQVCETKRIEQTEEGQTLLGNTAVLEYNSDRRWNYVNPLVKQCDAFQKALSYALDFQQAIERALYDDEPTDS